MAACVACSAPVASKGTLCTECSLERAFGVPEDHIDNDDDAEDGDGPP